jgi:hypothetical protein
MAKVKSLAESRNTESAMNPGGIALMRQRRFAFESAHSPGRVFSATL